MNQATMTLEEIKTSVEAGKAVYCGSKGYQVIKDNLGQWLIQCTFNDYCVGLTWRDGKTMNGHRFFIGE